MILHSEKYPKLFSYFEELTKIPRASGKEEKIADYLVAFAKKRNLFCYRDGENNVFIRKKGKKEGSILLQGHTDMVCEKNPECTINFDKDPLDIFVEDGWLKAKGTTLGADDGTAVAIMLTLLDDEEHEFPTLECLFTTSEEVGMEGAKAFDCSLIQSKMLLNLDSEDLGVVTCGCAGGMRTEMIFTPDWERNDADALNIRIGGLEGGHSGNDIDKNRGNAILLMLQLLNALPCDWRLASINGGEKDNAIPRECNAVIVTCDEDIVKQTVENFHKTLTVSDKGILIEITKAKAERTIKTFPISVFLDKIPFGVIKMHEKPEGLVQFSRNFGVIRTEGDNIRCVLSTRSDVNEDLDESIVQLDKFNGICSVRHYARYPGWAYAEQSPLRDAYEKVYREVTGKDCKIEVIHAGLECGLIASRIPGLDIISVGPDTKDIHTPRESLHLESFEILYTTILKLLTEYSI